MIQRIQSIYLLLIFIGCVFVFLFPLANYSQYDFFVLGAKQTDSDPAMSLNLNTIPLILIITAIGLMSFVTIFLYKNRPMQIKLTKTTLLLNILLIVAIFFYADNIEKKLNSPSHYNISSYIPLLTLILTFLASKAIKKDEELVKSADRLR